MIDNVRESREIVQEILGYIVKYLRQIFGNSSVKKLHASKIVSMLSSKYPALFQESSFVKSSASSISGYGLGGGKGLKNLSQMIVNKV